MRFLTEAESQEWARVHGFREDVDDHEVTVRVPQEPGRILSLARFVASAFGPRRDCLLWVTGWGVWPSSENWHLYYALRQRYSEVRLLHEAPGHLFLDYESADLESFLHLALLYGWDAHVLPNLTYGGAAAARAFVSHDEHLVLRQRDPEIALEWRVALGATHGASSNS